MFSLIAGCSSAPQKPTVTTQEQLSRLPEFTYASVSQEIRKGETTQVDLIRILGNPDKIYKNQDNNEVWTYTEQSYDPNTAMLGGGIVLYGASKGFVSATAHSYDLIVEWSKKGVVRNFVVSSAKL